MQKGKSFHLTEENHATLGPVWLVEPRTEYTKRAEIVEPRIEGQAALRGKVIPTNGMRGAYVQTQVNSVYTHTHGIAFMHLWPPSDLCPTSLKKCKRCLWPRMFLTQITSVTLSEKKNTGFQWHIYGFFEPIVRATSKCCFHFFLLLTGIYHSIATAWAGLRFP